MLFARFRSIAMIAIACCLAQPVSAAEQTDTGTVDTATRQKVFAFKPIRLGRTYVSRGAALWPSAAGESVDALMDVKGRAPSSA